MRIQLVKNVLDAESEEFFQWLEESLDNGSIEPDESGFLQGYYEAS